MIWLNSTVTELISYGYEFVFPSSDSQEPPDFWQEQTKPYTFLFLLVWWFFPRLFLLLKFSWKNPLLLVGAWFVPELTLIFVHLWYGYYKKNFLLLGSYTFWFLLKSIARGKTENPEKCPNSEQDLPTVVPPTENELILRLLSLLESVVQHATNSRTPFQNHTVLQGLKWIVETFGKLLKRLDQEHQLNELIFGDRNAIKSLNTMQLSCLREHLSEIVDRIDDIYEDRLQNDQRDVCEKEDNSMCVICLTRPASLELQPCLHHCLCNGCYKDFISHQQTEYGSRNIVLQCPVCRTPIISASGLSSAQRIPLSEYHHQTTEFTSLQLANLRSFVKENPNFLQLKKLQHCTPQQILQESP